MGERTRHNVSVPARRGQRRSYRTGSAQLPTNFPVLFDTAGGTDTLTRSVFLGGGGTPPDVVAGIPAAHQNDWGDDAWVFQDLGAVTTWHNRGHQGWKTSSNFLPSQGGGGGSLYQPSDAAGLGAQYNRQQALEPSGGNNAAENLSIGNETYLGVYMRKNGQSGSLPPFTDWYDDTIWNAVTADLANYAQTVAFLGMTGLSWDLEIPNWTAGITAGKTAAQDRARVRSLFFNIGIQLWTASPTLRLAIYNWSLPGSWGDKIQQVVNAGTFPNTTKLYHDALQGLFDAMRSLNAPGAIDMVDSHFYRTAAQYTAKPAATNRAAYQLNTLARAWLSTYWDQAVWDYACDKLHICGFTWRGTDGATFNDNTEPTDAGWSQIILDARNYSEGSRRWEYNHDPSVAAGSNWAGAFAFYSTATSLSGTAAASSTTPISTVVPTITNLDAISDGTTVTVTCNGHHIYGVEEVKVFTAAVAYLGAMQMVENDNGGDYLTNYDAAFQQCTYRTPGAVGTAFVVAAKSIRGDVHYVRVTAHA